MHLAVPELETLRLEIVDGDIAVMTMDRPERRNAQNVRMFTEYRLVARALRDDDLRALIIIGAEDRAFSAGFDLEEIDEITRMSIPEFLAFVEVATGGLADLRALPFPVIAAVNGDAVGGGLALALAADLRIAASTARFGAAFVRVGLSVGELGTSWQLTRLVGPGRAAELAFTGRLVDADEAMRIGLVNRVVAPARLMAEALEVATTIAAHSTGGVRRSKRALQHSPDGVGFRASIELTGPGEALRSG